MKRGRVDFTLSIILVLMLISGMVIVFSASSIMAESRYGSLTYFFVKQMIWGVISLAMMIAASRFNYQLLKKPPFPFILIIAAYVLLAGLFFFGTKINGAIRWYKIGPFSFQPSEYAKWALIVYFSYYLASPNKNIRNLKTHLMPLISILGGIVVLIMLQPDLSTSIMLVLICVSLLFIGGARKRHIAGMSLMTAPAVTLMMNYQFHRIESWWRAIKDPLAADYQLRQSLIGLGRGGWFGNGLGQSKQKFFFLPDSHTDFVFSIFGEEAGFIGTTIVLLLFLVILYRGIIISKKCPDNFGKFLAAGITFSIVYYGFINAAVVSMVVPTTGLPMPFISYGGSNLLFLGISAGLLLGISRSADSAGRANWGSYKERQAEMSTAYITAD